MTMTTKKKHTRARGVPFTTTLPPDVWARLHALSQAWNLPMSTLIAEAVMIIPDAPTVRP